MNYFSGSVLPPSSRLASFCTSKVLISPHPSFCSRSAWTRKFLAGPFLRTDPFLTVGCLPTIFTFPPPLTSVNLRPQLAFFFFPKSPLFFVSGQILPSPFPARTLFTSEIERRFFLDSHSVRIYSPPNPSAKPFPIPLFSHNPITRGCL